MKKLTPLQWAERSRLFPKSRKYRNEQIRKKRAAGMTLRAIADQYGLTQQGVGEIVRGKQP